MILCIGPTPAEQRVMIFRSLKLDAVNRAIKTLDGAAGKSTNVSKALAALGEQVTATGFLGGERGERLLSILQPRGIRCDFVDIGFTRLCITVIDESNGTQTELVQESQAVEPSHYQQLENIVRTQLKTCEAVIMSGTLTPGGPADFYFRCTQLANAAGALAVIDAQGPPLIETLRASPGLVKPNRLELASSLGKNLDTDSELMRSMRELHELGAKRIVITAGKQPAFAFDGTTFWRVFAPRVKAVNPIGSGDCFTAALVWRLLQGDDLGEASRWGTAAGTANVLTTLAGEIEKSEVERLLGDARIEKISGEL